MAGKVTTTPSKKTSGKSDEVKSAESKIPRTYRKSPARMDASGDARAAPKSPSRSVAGRSPARTANKSPAKPRSPARRSPAREKSPHRSPGRPRKTIATPPRSGATKPSAKQASSTPASSKQKLAPPILIDSDSDSDYAPTEKPKATVQGRTRRSTDLTSKLTIIEPPPTITHQQQQQQQQQLPQLRTTREDSAMRRSARLIPTHSTTLPEQRSKIHYEPIVKLTEFSDDDDMLTSQSSGKMDAQQNGRNKPSLGSVIGNVVFGLLFPALMLGLNAICTQRSCKFQLPALTPLTQLSYYYDFTVIASTLAFVLLLTVLTVIPFGGRIIKGLPSKSGHLTYCTNGLFVLSITLTLTAVALLYRVPVLPFVRSHWMHYNVTFLVLALLVACVLYVRGRNVPLSLQNPQGMTTSGVLNFLEGKEVNPRLFGVVDVKYVMFRVAIIALLLLNVCFTHASLTALTKDTPFPETGPSPSPSPTSASYWPKSLTLPYLNIQPTFLTLSAIQLIYIWDLLIFERTIISSYEVQYAGTGLLKCYELLGGIFTYSLVTRYVLDNNIELAWWKLVLSATLFLVGYFLYRLSNLQKHAFRTNPYNPTIAHYDSIPTNTGRKLLVSGLWGFVRHPNYLGDLLIHLSLVPYVCCAPPSIVVYATCLGLIARASTDNTRCKAKYGTAWDRYCQRVRYILVPKVY